MSFPFLARFTLFAIAAKFHISLYGTTQNGTGSSKPPFCLAARATAFRFHIMARAKAARKTADSDFSILESHDGILWPDRYLNKLKNNMDIITIAKNTCLGQI